VGLKVKMILTNKAEMQRSYLNSMKSMLYYGAFCIALGNAFIYGHYILSTIYKPIEIEFFPSNLKTKNYIRCSGNIRRRLFPRKPKEINKSESFDESKLISSFNDVRLI
jgi:hypothetical protein